MWSVRYRSGFSAQDRMVMGLLRAIALVMGKAFPESRLGQRIPRT